MKTSLMKWAKVMALVAIVAVLATAFVQANGQSAREPKGAFMETIYFDYDSATIMKCQIDRLDKNVNYLKQFPDAVVTVQGQADEKGPNGYNKDLGKRRAKAVKNYLVDKGICAKNIKICSIGEESPLDAAHDAKAHSVNRRVLFYFEGECMN